MMELLILGLFAVPIYLFVRFSARTVAWLSGRRFRSYRLLAQRYRGRYENRGLSDPPTVSFFHNGSTVRVGLAPPVPGQVSPPRTRVVVKFANGLPFRLELSPVARPSTPQPPKGTRPVRFGDSEFDRVLWFKRTIPKWRAASSDRRRGRRSGFSNGSGRRAGCCSRSIPSGCWSRSIVTSRFISKRSPQRSARRFSFTID